MTDRSTRLFRFAAFLVAALGLVPFVAAGVTSGNWNVARLTIIDPLVVVTICAAIAWAFGARARAALSALHRAIMRLPAPVLLGIVAIAIVTSAFTVSRLAFAGQPAMTDELTQAFHGRIVQSGRIAAEPEQYAEFFETPQTVRRVGRWSTEYPIGSGILAAFGDVTRLSALLNPLLMVFAAFATFSFARRAYDETTARITVILIALSPFAIFMSASRMSHVPTLTLTAAAFAALARWDAATTTATRAKWAAAIGAAFGGIALLRPYDALLIAIPVGIFQLTSIARSYAVSHAPSHAPSHVRSHAFSLAVQIAIATAIAAAQLWINSQTTGSPFLFGYDAINGDVHRPGFHRNPLGFEFTPSQGLDLVMLYLSRLNTSLFEWAIPSVFFIGAAMWMTKPARWDWLLAGLMFSLMAGYGAYWFDGNFAGPRFLFPALIAFVVFIARFIAVIPSVARDDKLRVTGLLLVPVCIVIAFLPGSWGNRSTGVILRLESMRRNPVAQSPDPAADAEREGIRNALVFVREPLHSRITARLRALGMAPYDAERTVADLDACAMLTALARSDARTDLQPGDRLGTVFRESQTADRPQMISGYVGAAALSLARGAPSSEACRSEITGDSVGVEAYERFLAASHIDSTGRLGGDVIWARHLGARDTILRSDPRFAGRTWYLYRRAPGTRDGRFVPYR